MKNFHYSYGFAGFFMIVRMEHSEKRHWQRFWRKKEDILFSSGEKMHFKKCIFSPKTCFPLKQ